METRQYGEITTYETRGEANEKVDRSKRYKQILAILAGRKLTAKEIAVEMYEQGLAGTSERNLTAPRLTELCYKGEVEVVGKVTCRYSGHKVAVYQVRGC